MTASECEQTAYSKAMKWGEEERRAKGAERERESEGGEFVCVVSQLMFSHEFIIKFLDDQM